MLEIVKSSNFYTHSFIHLKMCGKWKTSVENEYNNKINIVIQILLLNKSMY